jgi:hypothetical protein
LGHCRSVFQSLNSLRQNHLDLALLFGAGGAWVGAALGAELFGELDTGVDKKVEKALIG